MAQTQNSKIDSEALAETDSEVETNLEGLLARSKFRMHSETDVEFKDHSDTLADMKA